MNIDYDLLKQLGIYRNSFLSLPIRAEGMTFIERAFGGRVIDTVLIQKVHILHLPNDHYYCASYLYYNENLFLADELWFLEDGDPPGYYCEQCIYEHYPELEDNPGPRLDEVLRVLRSGDPRDKQPKGEQK